MYKLSYILLLIGLTSWRVNSARILAVFPMPSLSHQVAFQPVINELNRRGHEIVVITADPQYSRTQPPANFTEIDVHDVSYNIWNLMLKNEISRKEGAVVDMMTIVYTRLATVFNEQMKVKDVKDIILKRKGKFDLLLTETVFRPALAFSHIYNIPLIQISSFGSINFNDLYIGALTHPLLYPIPWHKRLYNLTIWERIEKLYHHYKFRVNYDYYIGAYENEIIREHFGPDTPTVDELCNNIQMLILNVHPLWIDNQPTPPNVIYMNSVHLKPEKPLPEDLKSFLDSSKNGTIYVSFGTNVIPSELKSDKLNILLNSLSQLPYDVLFKWNRDELPRKADNIKIAKWLPQADVLRHPKIKAFITQGGLQSFDEAMVAGVPLIGIPLFADQWYNVEKFVKEKVGIKLDLESLTEEGVKDAVYAVIHDQSYRDNLLRLRTLMQDQPEPPLGRAVWWVEYVLRHGGATHLRAPTANMSMAHFLQLDVILIALSAVCTILAVIVYVVYKIYRSCRIFKIKKH